MLERGKGGDPFIFTLALKPVPQAVVHAREMIAFALEHWGFGGDRVHFGKLVVSELVTNAVAASRDDQFITLRAFLGERAPVVEVWDESEAPPVPRSAAEQDETGRGLLLVEMFVNRWGTNKVTGGGKVVWAELRVE